VNRDSGTDSANGGWLRRLVRPRVYHISTLAYICVICFAVNCRRSNSQANANNTEQATGFSPPGNKEPYRAKEKYGTESVYDLRPSIQNKWFDISILVSREVA